MGCFPSQQGGVSIPRATGSGPSQQISHFLQAHVNHPGHSCSTHFILQPNNTAIIQAPVDDALWEGGKFHICHLVSTDNQNASVKTDTGTKKVKLAMPASAASRCMRSKSASLTAEATASLSKAMPTSAAAVRLAHCTLPTPAKLGWMTNKNGRGRMMLRGGGSRGRVVVPAHGASHSLALQQDAHSVLQRADLTSLDLLAQRMSERVTEWVSKWMQG
ncbi:MAG: hypothetical protein FRX49_12149 [Trebouxia sp. A1-2]|nr:MAG: hypothetical protein FRX49_12149 [Trebouxia sp. A1-2]